MSNDWIEEQFLRFEDFSDQEIVEIKGAIPTALQLVQLLQKDETDLTHIVMLVKSLLPVANVILTKLKARIS
jgi:hypothetical protein